MEDGVQILFDSLLICEKGEIWERILGKAYGIKVCHYLEHLGGKHWKQIKKKHQIIQRTSHLLQNKKNHGSLEFIFHLLSIIFISTFVSHHF
jgi:hypothetical protein